LFGAFAARTVDKLDVRHRRVVADAEAAFEDAQIAALALAVTRAELDEQLADRLLVAQARECEAAIGDAVASVISGSATRRSSFAFGNVVRISSCLNSEDAMFLNMASRWLLVRLSLRPDFL